MEDTLSTSEQKERFTLAELEPDKRKAILESLSRGVGIVATAKECGVSDHTVTAVRDSELDANPRFAAAYYQTRLVPKLLSIASQGMDQIEKRIEQIPAAALGVTVGIAIDKFLALSGQPGVIHEVRHTVTLGDAGGPGAGKVIDV